jgi:hypothetical protein
MENYSAEATQARLAAVAQIRARVGPALGNWLRDDECVQIALASATRAHADLTEFLFNTQVAKAASKQAKALAITPLEWEALYGWKARPTRSKKLEGALAEPMFANFSTKLHTSLRTTISEKEQHQIWTRGWSRAACVFAAHVEKHEDFLSTSLGNLVRGDLRRLEDLRTEVDDDGVDVMLLGQVIASLAESVV